MSGVNGPGFSDLSTGKKAAVIGTTVAATTAVALTVAAGIKGKSVIAADTYNGKLKDAKGLKKFFGSIGVGYKEGWKAFSGKVADVCRNIFKKSEGKDTKPAADPKPAPAPEGEGK